MKKTAFAACASVLLFNKRLRESKSDRDAHDQRDDRH